MIPRRALATGVLVLLMLVLGAFSPALEAGFIWDDDSYLTENPAVREPGGLKRIWLEPGATPQYYPLVFTLFTLQHRLWGFDPFGYHAVNLLLHAAAAVLLWLTLAALRVPWPFLSAALFALHPVQVESVVWVTELKNVLSGLFALAAALAYLSHRSFHRCAAAPRGAGAPFLYRSSLALFLLALWSKTVTATLPAALLILAWWKRGRLERRDLVEALPFFAAGGALASITVWMERHHVRAVGPEWDFSLAQRLVIAGKSFWFSLGKLLWPAELAFIYPRWEIAAAGPAELLFPAAAVALMIVLWLLRRRCGRGPAAALLLYAVVLSPALGFVDFYPMRFSFVADHYQYLACIGPLCLAAGALRTAGLRLAGQLRGPAAWIMAAAPAAAALGVLMALANSHAAGFRDELTLWRETIRSNPQAKIAHNNLGMLLRQQRRTLEALDVYRLAVSRWPDDPDFRNGLGLLLFDAGDLSGAIGNLREAARLAPERPEHFYNLGNALSARGDLEAARQSYLAALLRAPESSSIRNNLGVVLVKQSRWDEAREQFLLAVRQDPGNAEAARNLAKLRTIVAGH